MRAKLAPIIVLALTISACGNDFDVTKNPKPPKQSRIPTPETMQTLRNVKPGLGGKCIDFEAYYRCADTRVDLLDESQSEVDSMMQLSEDAQGRQIYTFSDADENKKVTMAEIVKTLKGQTDNSIQYLLYMYVTAKVYQFIDYLYDGIKADGNIYGKEISIFMEKIAFQYSVDCFDNIMSMHYDVAGDGGRWIAKKLADGSLEMESRHLDEAGAIVVEKGVCVPAEKPIVTKPRVEIVKSDESEQVEPGSVEKLLNWLFDDEE